MKGRCEAAVSPALVPTALAGSTDAARPEHEERIVQLVHQLRTPLFRYLLCIGVHPDDADDVTQETFLRLFGHLRRERHDGNLRAWVFRVAHNLALNERRDRRHFTLQGPHEWRAYQDVPAAAAASPERLLLERERMAAVHAGMDALSPQELRCVHLRIEGLRYREIGEVLGVTVSTVAEVLRRALSKLGSKVHG